MSMAINGRQKSFLGAEEAAWRPVHYLGSKLRLAPLIRDLLDGMTEGPVCDLFSGSGTVAFSLSHARTVHAADIQEYSRVLCAALLSPSEISDRENSSALERAAAKQRDLERCCAPVLEYEQRALEDIDYRPELMCDIVDNGTLLEPPAAGPLAAAIEATRRQLSRSGYQPLITTYFGGRFFSFRQAIFLDCVLGQHPSETWLASILSTASDLVNSVGKHFAQPMRPRRKDGSIKAHVLRQMQRDRVKAAEGTLSRWLSRYRSIKQSRPHTATRGDYRDILKQLNDVSVIYADPPYTRDHYSRFYHVLETMCLQDFPEVSNTFDTGPTSRGLYRSDRHQSPFCIKSQAPKAFRDLFSCAHGVPMLLSYSPYVKNGHPRLMTIEGIVSIAREFYKEVEVVSANMTHSKLNKSDLHKAASAQAEVFLVCS